MKMNKRKDKKQKNRTLKISVTILAFVLFIFLIKDDFKNMNVLIALGRDRSPKTENVIIPDSTLDDIYAYIASLSSLDSSKINITSSDSEHGVFDIKGADSKFHVLQITDVHISGLESNYGKNIAALKTVYELVQREHPDFIVVTGDLIFGTSETTQEADERSLDIVLKFMEQMGVKWTWSYGNHDHSALDYMNQDSLSEQLSQCDDLYMAGKLDNVTGASNAVFRVYNGNHLMTALFSIDSNSDIVDEENDFVTYGYIDDSQVDWYEQRINELVQEGGTNMNTFVFTHIPLQQYNEDAKVISGKREESVNCSNIASGIFDKIRELGSTKAIFCGHDHLNNTISQYMGIYLVYSKSIDYTAYVGIDQMTEQRGACSIQLTKQDYQIKNITYK